MFRLSLEAVHIFSQVVCYNTIVNLRRKFRRVGLDDFICQSECRGPMSQNPATALSRKWQFPNRICYESSEQKYLRRLAIINNSFGIAGTSRITSHRPTGSTMKAPLEELPFPTNCGDRSRRLPLSLVPEEPRHNSAFAEWIYGQALWGLDESYKVFFMGIEYLSPKAYLSNKVDPSLRISMPARLLNDN